MQAPPQMQIRPCTRGNTTTRGKHATWQQSLYEGKYHMLGAPPPEATKGARRHAKHSPNHPPRTRRAQQSAMAFNAITILVKVPKDASHNDVYNLAKAELAKIFGTRKTDDIAFTGRMNMRKWQMLADFLATDPNDDEEDDIVPTVRIAKLTLTEANLHICKNSDGVWGLRWSLKATFGKPLLPVVLCDVCADPSVGAPLLAVSTKILIDVPIAGGHGDHSVVLGDTGAITQGYRWTEDTVKSAMHIVDFLRQTVADLNNPSARNAPLVWEFTSTGLEPAGPDPAYVDRLTERIRDSCDVIQSAGIEQAWR